MMKLRFAFINEVMWPKEYDILVFRMVKLQSEKPIPYYYRLNHDLVRIEPAIRNRVIQLYIRR